MNERRLLRLRELLGWLAAACCLGAGLALADSFLASALSGPSSCDILPGGVERLSGPLPPGVDDGSALRATLDHPGLSFEPVATARGFWLGNRLWQGRLLAAADIGPGTATLRLRPPDGTVPDREQTFTIRIFSDADARNAASNSRIKQLLGLSPLVAAALCGVAAAVAGLLVYLASCRLEALWVREGKAVVYMTNKTPQGQLISFGLGARQGLAPGARVAVSDESGLPVAMASVVRCSPGDAVALVVGEERVSLGNIVRLAAPAGSGAALADPAARGRDDAALSRDFAPRNPS